MNCPDCGREYEFTTRHEFNLESVAWCICGNEQKIADRGFDGVLLDQSLGLFQINLPINPQVVNNPVKPKRPRSGRQVLLALFFLDLILVFLWLLWVLGPALLPIFI